MGMMESLLHVLFTQSWRWAITMKC